MVPVPYNGAVWCGLLTPGLFILKVGDIAKHWLLVEITGDHCLVLAGVTLDQTRSQPWVDSVHLSDR